MNREKLERSTALHKLWLSGDPAGVKADLSRQDLYRRSLPYTDLSSADLSIANLSGANLYRANLRGANLAHADMSFACLESACLKGARLINANLTRADLSFADLSDSDLQDATLANANLYDANLTGAKLPLFQRCPHGVDITGYKKVIDQQGACVVIEILVPADARKTSLLTSSACRCDRATVVRTVSRAAFVSGRESHLFYGSLLESPDYDPDIRRADRPGIVFFLSEKEAALGMA